MGSRPAPWRHKQFQVVAQSSSWLHDQRACLFVSLGAPSHAQGQREGGGRQGEHLHGWRRAKNSSSCCTCCQTTINYNLSLTLPHCQQPLTALAPSGCGLLRQRNKVWLGYQRCGWSLTAYCHIVNSNVIHKQVLKPGVEDLLGVDLQFLEISAKILQFIDPSLERTSLVDILGALMGSWRCDGAAASTCGRAQ